MSLLRLVVGYTPRLQGHERKRCYGDSLYGNFAHARRPLCDTESREAERLLCCRRLFHQNSLHSLEAHAVLANRICGGDVLFCVAWLPSTVSVALS